MIRSAVPKPLAHTGRLSEKQKRLFTRRHALIKVLQRSETWQARLEAAQAAPLREKGAQRRRN